MADANELVQLMKKAAVDAIEAAKPVNVYFGEVRSVSPLTINVEQKMVLGKEQLILTRNVTDFETMVTMNWESEEAGREPHTHMIAGQKQITIHNALEVAEEVILIRQQGGQKFIVLDRIGGKT